MATVQISIATNREKKEKELTAVTMTIPHDDVTQSSTGVSCEADGVSNGSGTSVTAFVNAANQDLMDDEHSGEHVRVI